MIRTEGKGRAFFSFGPFALISLVAVVLGTALGGPAGGFGMTIGLIGATFNLYILWRAIGFLGATTKISGADPRTAAWIVVAFFAKLPVYVMLGSYAHKVGGSAPTNFLFGVGLVYFFMVGWALAQH